MRTSQLRSSAFLSVSLLLVLAPCIALPDPTSTPLSEIGQGPSGYDFMIGRWKCVSTDPTDKSYWENTFIYAHRANLTKSLELDWQSQSGIWTSESLKYDTNTKVWSGMIVEEDVNRSAEFSNSEPLKNNEIGNGILSTSDTGPKSVWTGSFKYLPGYMSAAAGTAGMKTAFVRWTWTFSSSTELSNLQEWQASGAWDHPVEVDTCSKI